MPKVTLVVFTVLGDDRFGLFIGQIADSLLRVQVKHIERIRETPPNGGAGAVVRREAE